MLKNELQELQQANVTHSVEWPRSNSLKWIRDATGSQWRSWSRGEMWAERLVEVRT